MAFTLVMPRLAALSARKCVAEMVVGFNRLTIFSLVLTVT